MRPGPARRALTGAGAALALAALVCPAGARAAGDPAAPIALRWTAPAGCPTEAEVSAEVEHALGGPPDAASSRHLRAEAAVTRDGKEGFRVHLVTDMGGALGEREFGGHTCAAVARATALIVALTFDPEALTRRTRDGAPASPPPSAASPSSAGPPPASPPTLPPTLPSSPPPVVVSPPLASLPPPSPSSPVVVPPPSPSPVPLPVPSPSAPLPVPPLVSPPPPVSPPALASGTSGAEPSPATRPRVLLGFLTAASLGALPSVGFGFGGRVGLLAGPIEVDLSAAYWPDRSGAASAKAGAGGEFRLVDGDARACYAFALARLDLGPCAGLEVGRMSAEGFGVKAPGSGAALWIAPLVEATVALRLHPRFALRLDAGALFPVERPTFVLQNVGSVHTASAAVGRAALGAEVRF